MKSSLSTVLVVIVALTACAPQGTPLAAPISRFEAETFVLDGDAYTMAELDGVTTWARLEGADVVPIATLPSEHGSVGDVLPLAPMDVLAIAGGALLALEGDRFTVAGTVDDGGPDPADLCGRDESGAVWIWGARTILDHESVEPRITESRLLRFEGGSFTSEALPQALADTYADCWMMDGEIWAFPSNGLIAWQRTASGWVEHMPWLDEGAGGSHPRALRIAGRTYVDGADRLWERRDGEWITQPFPSALPSGGSLEYQHIIAARAPNDLVVAQPVYAEVCGLFGCGSQLERVELYRFDGVAWHGVAALPPLEVQEASAVPEVEPIIVRHGATHLWLAEDGAHLILGGRLHYGPL